MQYCFKGLNRLKTVNARVYCAYGGTVADGSGTVQRRDLQ